MSVFLRKQNLKRGIYLSFVESTYDPISKNSKQITIKKIGYVDELKKDYVDPISYFTDEAKKLSEESSKKYLENKEAKAPRESSLKNIGYFLPLSIYKKFAMTSEFKFLTIDRKFDFDVEDVYRFLLLSQINNPRSKIQSYCGKDIFLDKYDFSDDQMYDAIKLIGQNKNYILEHIRYELKSFYKLNTSFSFFDGTNIYFEIDKENEMLKRGPEKNNRHDPILGLGLLMDGNGVPTNYTTFPGNQSEQGEMHKNIQRLKKADDIKGRTIIIADKGLNSGNNMYQAIKNGDGYVMGQKVRGGNKDLLAWILDESDYQIKTNENDEIIYKIKSEVGDYKVNITSPLNGAKAEIILKQKRVLFYSKDYADKAKHEREKLIAKAYDLISNPSNYKKKTIGDAATYIKEIHFTKDGEIAENQKLEINIKSIEEEAKLDGYYLIVTSETNCSNDDIIKMYRGLWEIEETFSIIKGVLKVRPVFAKSIEAIEAHILICFHAVLILRLLQKVYLKDELTREQLLAIEQANRRKKKHKIRLEKVGEIPMKQLVSFIREYQAMKIDGKYFVCKYHELMPVVEKMTSLKLDKHRLSESDLKKFFSIDLQHTTKSKY